MDGHTAIQITTIIVGGIVTIAGMYFRQRLLELQHELDVLRATVASTHALMLGQSGDLSSVKASMRDLRDRDARRNQE